jgi:hypothetical protein
MENQTVPVVTPQVVVESKGNNFLVILLSILLFISLAIAGFFAFQTQKLVKELSILRSNPTPVATVVPTTEQTETNVPTATSLSKPLRKVTTYQAPATWVKFTTKENLKLCLPPKWEIKNEYGELIYNRDSSYQPTITIIQNIPYDGGSVTNSYYSFWKSEYPNIEQLVSSSEVDVNGSKVKLITPKVETKLSPEGMSVVWYASGKMWKAGLSNWNQVNTSKSEFLNDFYTMIGCSF